jgi:predicted transcriptional regulator
LQRAIQLRFGIVSAEIQEQLPGLSFEQLEDLMEIVLTPSLKDLMQQLTAIASSATVHEDQLNLLKTQD